MEPQATLLMTTVDSEDLARTLAGLLLEKRLAACVQEVRINSRYRWDNEVRCDAEILLLVKTSAASVPEALRVIEANHSYDVPEIIALPVTAGLPAYLEWIAAETGGQRQT